MKKTVSTLSIIMPVFNERDNIEKVVRIVDALVRIPYNLIIVYDFDEDNTLPVVRELQREYNNIQLVKNVDGRGPVNAVMTGFKENDSDFVCILCADLTDDVGAIPEMYDSMKSDKFDIVSATRYVEGGQKYGGPWFKTQLSRFLNILFQRLTRFPLSDITYSFGMYHKNVVDSINIESCGGWEMSMEIAIKAFLNGRRMTEIPVIWVERQSGSSQFKLFEWSTSYFKWFLFGVTHINGRGKKFFKV